MGTTVVRWTLPTIALLMAIAAAFVIGGIAFAEWVENTSRDGDVCFYPESVYGTDADKKFTANVKAAAHPFMDSPVIGTNTIVIVPKDQMVYIEEIDNNGIIQAFKGTMRSEAFTRTQFSFVDAYKNLASDPKRGVALENNTLPMVVKLGHAVINKLTINEGGVFIVQEGARVLVAGRMNATEGRCGRLTETTANMFDALYLSHICESGQSGSEVPCGQSSKTCPSSVCPGPST